MISNIGKKIKAKNYEPTTLNLRLSNNVAGSQYKSRLTHGQRIDYLATAYQSNW